MAAWGRGGTAQGHPFLPLSHSSNFRHIFAALVTPETVVPVLTARGIGAASQLPTCCPLSWFRGLGNEPNKLARPSLTALGHLTALGSWYRTRCGAGLGQGRLCFKSQLCLAV